MNEACGKLELDPTHYDLCEVQSSGEKVLLKDSDISVHSEMSVNGRLYIVPKGHSARTLVRLRAETQPLAGSCVSDLRTGSCGSDLRNWVLGFRSWELGLVVQILGTGSCGSDLGNWVIGLELLEAESSALGSGFFYPRHILL